MGDIIKFTGKCLIRSNIDSDELNTVNIDLVNNLLSYIKTNINSYEVKLKDFSVMKTLSDIKNLDNILINYNLGKTGEFEDYIDYSFKKTKKILNTLHSQNAKEIIYQFIVDNKFLLITKLKNDNSLKNIEIIINNYCDAMIKSLSKKVLYIFDMNINTYIDRIDSLSNMGERGLPSNFIDEYETILNKYEDMYKFAGIKSIELIRFRDLIQSIRSISNIKHIAKNTSNNIYILKKKQ